MLHLLAGLGREGQSATDETGMTFTPTEAPSYRCPPGTTAILTGSGPKCRSGTGVLTDPIIGGGGGAAIPSISTAGIGSLTPFLLVAGLAVVAWFGYKRFFKGKKRGRRRGRR